MFRDSTGNRNIFSLRLCYSIQNQMLEFLSIVSVFAFLIFILGKKSFIHLSNTSVTFFASNVAVLRIFFAFIIGDPGNEGATRAE